MLDFLMLIHIPTHCPLRYVQRMSISRKQLTWLLSESEIREGKSYGNTIAHFQEKMYQNREVLLSLHSRTYELSDWAAVVHIRYTLPSPLRTVRMDTPGWRLALLVLKTSHYLRPDYSCGFERCSRIYLVLTRPNLDVLNSESTENPTNKQDRKFLLLNRADSICKLMFNSMYA